ncbi:MAG: hypothetical protein GXO28_04905 [Methanopyri archaeon]|nr:hypothetical protein [Methanopyri archaeon]
MRYLLEETPEDPWLSSAYAVVKYVLEHSDRFVVPELCRDVRDTLEEDASDWIEGEDEALDVLKGMGFGTDVRLIDEPEMEEEKALAESVPEFRALVVEGCKVCELGPRDVKHPVCMLEGAMAAGIISAAVGESLEAVEYLCKGADGVDSCRYLLYPLGKHGEYHPAVVEFRRSLR